MQLTVLLPERQVLQTTALRVSAEGPEGAFTLLPAHADLVTVLAAGLLTYQVERTQPEQCLAVDAGLLIKRGEEVVVTVRQVLLDEL